MKRLMRFFTAIADGALSLSMKAWTPWEAAGVRETPRPSDAPRGHGPGYDSDRILLFGAGPAVGWGVTSHQLGLPGALAREISKSTGRGSDVDLISRPGMCSADALLAVDNRNWARYDAIIVTLGVNDALTLTTPEAWRDGLSGVLSALRERSPRDTTILVVGIHPIRSIPAFRGRRGAIAERRARLLNRETRILCAATERTTFVDLPAQAADLSVVDRHRTAKQYDQWAKVIAASLVPALTSAYTLDGDRRTKDSWEVWDSEAERQTAVDGMCLPQFGTDPQLERLVQLAQRAFKVQSALITVLDHDRQRYLANSGKKMAVIPRSSSFCEFAIRSDQAMLVRDTLQDERFRSNPLVVGEPHIRFYAGFPIETPSGHRIGTLCITDTQPRLRSDDIDLSFLRDLAHRTERELWEFLPQSK